MDASSGGTVTGRLELLTEDIMHADEADMFILLPGAGAGDKGIWCRPVWHSHACPCRTAASSHACAYRLGRCHSQAAPMWNTKGGSHSRKQGAMCMPVCPTGSAARPCAVMFRTGVPLHNVGLSCKTERTWLAGRGMEGGPVGRAGRHGLIAIPAGKGWGSSSCTSCAADRMAVLLAVLSPSRNAASCTCSIRARVRIPCVHT